MSVYPPLETALSSPTVTALMVHVPIIAASFILSLVGVAGVLKYGPGEAGRRRLLAHAFVSLSAITGADLLDHLGAFPGLEIWRHLGMVAGVISVYFIYLFVRSHSEEPRKHALPEIAVVAGLLGIGLFFGIFETAIEERFPLVFASVYSILVLLCVWGVYLLMRMQAGFRKAEKEFSIRTLSLALIPLISATVLVETASTVFSEYFHDIPQLEAYFQFETALLLAVKTVSCMVIGMSLLGFAYIAWKLDTFYAPLGKFVARK